MALASVQAATVRELVRASYGGLVFGQASGYQHVEELGQLLIHFSLSDALLSRLRVEKSRSVVAQERKVCVCARGSCAAVLASAAADCAVSLSAHTRVQHHADATLPPAAVCSSSCEQRWRPGRAWAHIQPDKRPSPCTLPRCRCLPHFC